MDGKEYNKERYKALTRPTRYEILTCECGEKHFTMEGMDNAYNCNKCYKSLHNKKPMIYWIKDKNLCKIIEDNFKGKLGRAHSEEE